ncbi:FliM/FliN family flagellar motor C-terminal domain-containing protein [Vibrio parahaemolyticus]|uniref:FliM/FliN family flagellar motor switch protein n=1 Tax=Vibrio parahaemolyticus TaxID=670 RepID=UPI000422E413|nr:FliM/FliN family flagellar motor C-terminal domain-containing protein [Vibrio parahaemolyticus]AMG08195.1 type III secretion protein [Vibrio parahaemolyticus]EGR0428623.1 FliM/FliN family flagellar motor switch protein [Vibrio parahaemolyticus]EJG0784419.1 FliM/FliN family flagellar motor switch protein [Vibrio parahaemolyticus]EJG1588978.1 FliM/FliN family flagellar motor switch protein [Vibrio parahaemolyticus]KKI09494.1 type III secretion protein [Vibrio parahaemolyticus]
MKIAIDVVIARCSMTLEELLHLQKGNMIKIDDFVQSEVMLKSGNELIATGTLIKIDDQYGVSIDNVNQVKS